MRSITGLDKTGMALMIAIITSDFFGFSPHLANSTECQFCRCYDADGSMSKKEEETESDGSVWEEEDESSEDD